MTIGILPECQFYKSESGCKFCDECSFAHGHVECQTGKSLKMGGDKNPVAILKNVRELGCVFHDTDSQDSLSISRKSTEVLGSIRRVRFTRATQRYANIRENKGPSLGKFQVKVLY